jgi:hypothetical protein
MRRVDVTVSGAGLVTSNDGQIQCGFSPRPSFQCQETVLLNGTSAKVQLQANRRPGARFTRWGGSCRGRKSVCVLTLPISAPDSETFPLTGLFRVAR